MSPLVSMAPDHACTGMAIGPRAARRAAWLLALALALSAATATAGAAADKPCGAALDARHRQVLDAAHHRLAFAPSPPPLVTGRHFALDIEVCPKAQAALPVALRVNADMPAHGHGMNYQPTVRALGNGRYRAEGLMLHMAGRWRLQFELSADGRLVRLNHLVDLP